MYRIVYDKRALKDIRNLKSAGLDKKARELIEVIRIYPFKIPPPYEALVGNLKGYFSRRINIQHRLVYEVFADPLRIKDIEYEGTVRILRMWSHYEGM